MPKGFSGEEVVRINEIREKVSAQFLELYPVLRKKHVTVKEITVGIYRFICGLDVEKQLREKELSYEKAGDLKNAKEYSQIYRIVMDLFDKMVDLKPQR